MNMKGDNFKMLNTKVGKNFTVADFACKCGCGTVMYTPRLVEVLDDLKDKLRADVVITSPYRCPERNREVGGVEDSLHMKGRAIDFVVVGYSPAKVGQYLSDFDGGVGIYSRHIHIDDGLKKRWDGQYAS